MAGTIFGDLFNLGADPLKFANELLRDGKWAVPVRSAMKYEYGNASEFSEKTLLQKIRVIFNTRRVSATSQGLGGSQQSRRQHKIRS